MEFSRGRGNPSRKFMEIPGSEGSNVKPPATENLGDGGQTWKNPWKVWIFLSVSKGYPARRVYMQLTQPRLWVGCVSYLLSGAKHNKHNSWRRKLFAILFQFPAWPRACSLPEVRLLHWSLQIYCHSVRQITLAKNIHLTPQCFHGLSHLG